MPINSRVCPFRMQLHVHRMHWILRCAGTCEGVGGGGDQSRPGPTMVIFMLCVGRRRFSSSFIITNVVIWWGIAC